MVTNIDLPRYVQVGDVTDVALLHTKTVMRDVGLNPDVVVDFKAHRPATICGVAHIIKLLEEVLPEKSASVWAVKDGARVDADALVMRIEAPYATFVSYQSTICGLLASMSGWASAAYDCTVAAGGKKNIIASCTYAAHPSIVAEVEYAATIGGCSNVSTPLAARIASCGTFSNIAVPLVLVVGSLEGALKEFESTIPQEVSRTARLGVMADEVADALAAIGSKVKVRRFLIGTHPSRGGLSAHIIKEVRAHLTQAGHTDVDIIVAGGLNPTKIAELVAQEAPITAFVVGEYIASAPSIPTTAEIVQMDGKSTARRGIIPVDISEAELERIL